MKKLFKNKKKAFTIVESLIAVFILTVGFLAVCQIFPFNLRINKSSEMKTKAIKIAQSKVEELNAMSYDEVNCSGTAPPCVEEEAEAPEDSAFRRVTSIKFANPQNNFQEPSPVSTDTEIKKIEITVSWDSVWGEGEDDVKIFLLISRK